MALDRKELLLGCGKSREKKLSLPGYRNWAGLVTLDESKEHKPDVVWNLENRLWPFPSNYFDEVHAYEVIEHCTGLPGDVEAFFRFFGEIWRILKPEGHLFGSAPSWRSEWAFGDPGHKRMITPGTFVFLSQEEYQKQVGITPMSDYRDIWQGDFKTMYCREVGEVTLTFVLKAIKSECGILLA